MAKYRSSLDFAQEYASNKQGIGRATDNFLHLKEETTAGTFVAPSIGTQGSSISAASPSTDITGSSNRNGRISVDGEAVTAFGLSSVTGLDTGPEIATALETAINTALEAAGLDARVWVEFSSTYRVRSQKTGTSSAVVITNGASLDLMTELKLGTANSGTEAAGTAGGDYLWMTRATLNVGQPVKASEHRSGRQPSSFIKEKKVADGEIETYINVALSGDPSIDTAASLLLEAVLGKKTTVGSVDEIRFDSTQAPSKYFSIVQGNNSFGRFFNGGYAKKLTISLPGSGEAKMMFGLKARDGKYASIAQVNGAVSGSANVVVNTGESKRFEVGARVMLVDDDGRTVVAGQDGSITVSSRTDGSHTVALSGSVSVDDNGYLVPWLPHVFDQSGTDNPITGLQGSVSFDGGSTTVEEIRSVEITFDHNVTDLDQHYGSDSNTGFVVADRAKIDVKVELMVSASQAQKIVQTKEFETFDMKVVLGPAAGLRTEYRLPKVIYSVPAVPIPDSGPVIMTLEGEALQSAAGELDAFTVKYLGA
jgi:hypothetical protein